jgi:hypothetical protein
MLPNETDLEGALTGSYTLDTAVYPYQLVLNFDGLPAVFCLVEKTNKTQIEIINSNRSFTYPEDVIRIPWRLQ